MIDTGSIFLLVAHLASWSSCSSHLFRRPIRATPRSLSCSDSAFRSDAARTHKASTSHPAACSIATSGQCSGSSCGKRRIESKKVYGEAPRNRLGGRVCNICHLAYIPWLHSMVDRIRHFLSSAGSARSTRKRTAKPGQEAAFCPPPGDLRRAPTQTNVGSLLGI